MKAVVVDFDGSLYRRNSFEDCVLMTLKACFKRMQLATFFRIAGWVALRKLRFISHARMKYQLQPVLEAHYPAEAFQERLHKGINKRVWKHCLAFRRDGYHLCLGTAAPSFYMEEIAQSLQFDSLSATERSEKPFHEWKENQGENKRDNCLEILTQAGAELEWIITDSIDDLPLIMVAPQHIFVNKDEV